MESVTDPKLSSGDNINPTDSKSVDSENQRDEEDSQYRLKENSKEETKEPYRERQNSITDAPKEHHGTSRIDTIEEFEQECNTAIKYLLNYFKLYSL
jgi:hypothetical protein